jgi:2-amino-4-hydroxy-6-hydroxymethyldihydropteridine diphosphokinase
MNKNTHTAYLLTGGNLGNRKKNLSKAIELIEASCGIVSKISSIYETAAWGFTEQPNFLNQVVELKTSLKPEVLMSMLLSIEEQMGRKRSVKMGPRVIDIDILMMGDILSNTDLLKLPHPELHNRRFALIPLSEIAAEIVHPVEKKTISQLLQQCSDSLDVQKI